MVQKKDRSRFSIKFNESDPAHDMTIRILENQGQRKIAPFLVNAVLHYMQCSETPDVSHMLAENPQPMINRNDIEDIVNEILRQQGIINEESKAFLHPEVFKREKIIENKSEKIQSQNMINEDMRSMIARTLSSLRNE